MENINKPIAIVMKEVTNVIVDTINNSKLPLCILDKMLKDIYIDVHNASELEYQNTAKEYEKQLTEAKSSKSKESKSSD